MSHDVEWWQDRYLEVEDERDRWKAEALAARKMLHTSGQSLQIMPIYPDMPESDHPLTWMRVYAAARAANDKENMNAKH